jgi:pimeloyl-ACP methyl ester carboxylesterase
MELGKAPVVGYSDGAIIALYMGLQYADLVDKLVPISANFHWNGMTEHMRSVFEKSTPEAFGAVLGDIVAYYNENSPDGPEHFPVVFAKLRKLFLSAPTLTTEDLANIKAPTLVLAADRDLMTIEHTVELFSAISGAKLCILPGTNHNLVFDRADEVCAAVLRFLGA